MLLLLLLDFSSLTLLHLEYKGSIKNKLWWIYKNGNQESAFDNSF